MLNYMGEKMSNKLGVKIGLRMTDYTSTGFIDPVLHYDAASRA